MSERGLIRRSSLHGFDKTIELLTIAIEKGGMRLAAKIDHSAAARAAGLSLRGTVVLIFGNAQAGTPLMLRNQEVGIDLPLKILVWDDAEGMAHVSYNAPAWIAERHGLIGMKAMLAVLERALAEVVEGVASPDGAECPPS